VVITPILISVAALAGAETGETSAIARAATSAVLIEVFLNI
jgi:hypothetical protein